MLLLLWFICSLFVRCAKDGIFKGIETKPSFACRLLVNRDISTLSHVQQKRETPVWLISERCTEAFRVKACVHLDQGYLLMNECSSVFSDKKNKNQKTGSFTLTGHSLGALKQWLTAAFHSSALKNDGWSWFIETNKNKSKVYYHYSVCKQSFQWLFSC